MDPNPNLPSPNDDAEPAVHSATSDGQAADAHHQEDPPANPSLSPAKAWTDPKGGQILEFSVDHLAEMSAGLDLTNKESIFTHFPIAKRSGVNNLSHLAKPPNHVLAGKDLPTVANNMHYWGTLSKQKQQLEVLSCD